MATQLGEALEIYNLKTQTHNVIYGPAGEPQFIAKGGEGFPTGIKGFVDIQVTDDYIYTVFDGMSWKERDKFTNAHVCSQRRPFPLRVRFGRKPGSKIYARQKYLGHPYNEKTNIGIATCAESDNPIVTFKL